MYFRGVIDDTSEQTCQFPLSVSFTFWFHHAHQPLSTLTKIVRLIIATFSLHYASSLQPVPMFGKWVIKKEACDNLHLCVYDALCDSLWKLCFSIKCCLHPLVQSAAEKSDTSCVYLHFHVVFCQWFTVREGGQCSSLYLTGRSFCPLCSG